MVISALPPVIHTSISCSPTLDFLRTPLSVYCSSPLGSQWWHHQLPAAFHLHSQGYHPQLDSKGTWSISSAIFAHSCVSTPHRLQLYWHTWRCHLSVHVPKEILLTDSQPPFCTPVMHHQSSVASHPLTAALPQHPRVTLSIGFSPRWFPNPPPQLAAASRFYS